jgi:hypothetical protein
MTITTFLLLCSRLMLMRPRIDDYLAEVLGVARFPGFSSHAGQAEQCPGAARAGSLAVELRGSPGTPSRLCGVAEDGHASFAEFEVDIIRLRTIEGMARARQRGKLKGKQPKLNSQQRAHLPQLDREGKRTPTELAGLFGVSRATIYRELKKAQEAAA